MGNQILRTVGTQICFANHNAGGSAFTPTTANDLRQGVPSEVQIRASGVATAAARQSAKCDLGEQRAPAYSVMAAIPFTTAPTVSTNVEFYWGPTPDPTAGNGNPGGLTGADAAYAGYAADLANNVNQLQYIGNLTVSAETNKTQIGRVGIFSPAERYGMLVIKNAAGQSIASDSTYGIQTHVVFNPIIDEVQ